MVNSLVVEGCADGKADCRRTVMKTQSHCILLKGFGPRMESISAVVYSTEEAGSSAVTKAKPAFSVPQSSAASAASGLASIIGFRV